MLKNISYVVISDIHFGHPVNRSHVIEEHLTTFFRQHDELFKTLDIFFVAGDIFHTILNSSSTDHNIAMRWLSTLANMCIRYDIKLRILEGTPSHDAKQCASFTSIIEKVTDNIDYKYIDTLMIEHMRDLDLTILYVPDEVNHTGSETLEEVKALMHDNYLNTVDIAIMHGSFDYRYKGLDLPFTHDEVAYLGLVERFISVGHEHTKSTYGRIIGQGSFDRLAHGEEEDKGAVYITLDMDDPYKDEYVFLVNKDATIFKTINVETEDIEELARETASVLDTTPVGSNIAFKVSSKNPIRKVISEISRKYPGYRFTTIRKDGKTKEEMITDVLEKGVDPSILRITPENIVSLVEEDLLSKSIVGDTLKTAVDTFQKLINRV